MLDISGILGTSMDMDTKGPTVDIAAEYYLEWLRHARQAPESTLVTYGRVIRAFATHQINAGATVEHATVSEVEAFLYRPRKGGAQPAAATVANEVSILSALYSWGQVRLGWGRNPAAL